MPHNQQPPEDNNAQSKRRGSKLHWPFGQCFSPWVLYTMQFERTGLAVGLTGQDPWLDTSICKEKTGFSIQGSVKGRKAKRSAQRTIKHAWLQASAVVYMRSSLLYVMQGRFVVSYRRFGRTYRSSLQGCWPLNVGRWVTPHKSKHLAIRLIKMQRIIIKIL